MDNINSKNAKTKINKTKIIFIMSVIFFMSSILTKINNTTMLLKENKNKEIINNIDRQLIEKETKNYREKENYILEISDTLGEALNYIRQNYKNETNLQVKTLLRDSIAGVSSISAALETMYSGIDNKSLKVKTNNLKVLFSELINLLDENNIEMAETIIDTKVLSEYNHWKNELESEFR